MVAFSLRARLDVDHSACTTVWLLALASRKSANFAIGRRIGLAAATLARKAAVRLAVPARGVKPPAGWALTARRGA